MKKIKVSGCLNCPYMEKTSNYGKESIIECKHHSFINCGGDFPVIKEEIIKNFSDGNPGDKYPDWCPLENN